MTVIDANSGEVLRVGTTFSNVEGTFRVEAIKPGLLSARIQLTQLRPPPPVMDYETGKQFTVAPLHPLPHTSWHSLMVRWTHPAFFLKHIAFLPS